MALIFLHFLKYNPDFRKDSLQSFPEQPSNITNVGLIKPKPGLSVLYLQITQRVDVSSGIFIDSMQHLLVLCTQGVLILLGLAAPETPSDPVATSQEFVVYDTELRFPTENVSMTSIVSASSGRAFMCGVTDGHLYEMQYQASEGWFGSKSSLYNHSVSGVTSFLPSLFASASSGELKRA
jgi:nuclear pore complex protein Nup155